MTDREENVEDSNAAMEEIDLVMSELTLESNRESKNAAEKRKKEQEDDPEDDETTITSNDLYHWEKIFLKEILQKCNRSYLAELEDPEMKELREKKMKEGRLLIEDVSDEDQKDQKKKSEESSSTSRIVKVKMYEYEENFDPMKLIREIIMGFCGYIDHIHEMATERGKDEQKWSAHFETGAQVMQKLTDKIQQLHGEIEGMKNRKDMKEKCVKIRKMLSKMEEINARLDGSPEIGIVSERDCTDLELELCECELKWCKTEMRDLIWEKAFLKEIPHKSNRSYLAELEDPEMKEIEKEMKEGRLLIKDVNNEDDQKKKSSEESSSTSRKGKEKMYESCEQKFDPSENIMKQRVLGPLYSVVGPLYSVVDPLYSVVDPLYSVVDPLYSVVDPLYSCENSQEFEMLDEEFGSKVRERDDDIEESSKRTGQSSKRLRTKSPSPEIIDPEEPMTYMDPLTLMEELVRVYYSYVNKIFLNVRYRLNEEQSLKFDQTALAELFLPQMQTLGSRFGRMKKYIKPSLHQIVNQVETMVERVDCSQSISLSTQSNCTKQQLMCCMDEINQLTKELIDLRARIFVLKI